MLGWLETEALAFQVQALPRDAQRVRHGVHLAVMRAQRRLDHFALDVGQRRDQRVVADGDVLAVTWRVSEDRQRAEDLVGDRVRQER